MSLRRRLARSRPRPDDLACARESLSRCRAALREGEGELAFDHATAAHLRLQNSPGLHAVAHLHLAASYLRQGRLGGTLGELRIGSLAPLASVVRRSAGYAPGEPNPAGILKTWRARR